MPDEDGVTRCECHPRIYKAKRIRFVQPIKFWACWEIPEARCTLAMEVISSDLKMGGEFYRTICKFIDGKILYFSMLIRIAMYLSGSPRLDITRIMFVV